ncbi:MAG: hypothetical protein JXD18_10480 [Anaerolineae bacterium]|nr:hypothetical protein [Anaerolineae bacterium]
MTYESKTEWRAAVLKNLAQGGPACQHAAKYLADNDIDIGFAEQSTGARWTMDGRIEVSAKHYSLETDPANPWLLGAVAHEAAHLEQGLGLALSVAGEVAAWRVEYLVREELGAPIKDPHWKVVAQTPAQPTRADLRKARAEVLEKTGYGYLIWVLPLRASRLIGAVVGGARKLIARKRR